jgi:hypothetical protein
MHAVSINKEAGASAASSKAVWCENKRAHLVMFSRAMRRLDTICTLCQQRSRAAAHSWIVKKIGCKTTHEGKERKVVETAKVLKASAAV